MFADRILDAIRLETEERYELEARRAAEDRRLFLSVHDANPEERGNEIEIHVIEPRGWRCLAIRGSWHQVMELLIDTRPIARRQLLERARPCALHPDAQAPAQEA